MGIKLRNNVQTRIVLTEKEVKLIKVENKISAFRPIPVEFEPKRNNRFLVEFPVEFEIESFLVQKINRPKIVFIQNIKELIGSYQWEDFNIEFIDVVGSSTTNGIINMIQFCQENKGINPNKPLFNFSIKSLDPVGVEVEDWIIEVQDLLKVDFGECDYGNDGLQKIKVTLRPFDCILNNNLIT